MRWGRKEKERLGPGHAFRYGYPRAPTVNSRLAKSIRLHPQNGRRDVSAPHMPRTPRAFTWWEYLGQELVVQESKTLQMLLVTSSRCDGMGS